MVNNNNEVAATTTGVVHGNRDANGEYLYTKEEMKELWKVIDTTDPNRTIETKIGLSAIFLHSKETGEIVKGSWRVAFIQNSLTWATFKELFLQSELGQKCLEVGATVFVDKQKNSWCDLIDNRITLMVEGPNTEEWGEGSRTYQSIRLTQNGLLKTEPIRIYLNNTKAFMMFCDIDRPDFNPEKIKFEKMEIQRRE